MKRSLFIGLIALLLLASCTGTTRKARQMVRRAERLADTLPDSTLFLIDSVLRMEVYFSERERMELAMLQGEVLFGHHDTAANSIPPLMDDEYFDDKPFFSTSPELEHAAAYFARKKQYDRAATAALYSGFVQQHYGENKIAMQSYKDAERYGEAAGDSLAVAMAQYWMGKMLLDDGLREDALVMLKNADKGFGNHLAEKALTQNITGVCYMLQGEYDNAENFLKRSLIHSEKSHIDRIKRRALNNYAVLYRSQRKFDLSIDYLRQIAGATYLNDGERFTLCLNMGKTFMAAGETDSASVYFQHLEDFLPEVNVKNESKLSAYGALSLFAKRIGKDSLALLYREKHEQLLYDVMQKRQEQSIYRIQKQYDYENLQNILNRKLLFRQRIIMIISILLLVSTVLIVVLQHRHKRLQASETEMKRLVDTMKEDLRQTVKSSVMEEEVVSRLNLMLAASRASKRAKDPQNEWNPLVKQVMNGKDNMFEAARDIIEMIYPNLYSILMEKYPTLTETEAKICLLSFCDISNVDKAELLGLRQNTINQNRSNLRKKLNLDFDEMKEQLRDALSKKA